MKTMFELYLSNGEDTKCIEFKIFKTDIAQSWAKEIDKNYPLYENNRFTSWPGVKRSKTFYESNIMRHIKNIEDVGHRFEFVNFSLHSGLNELHKHFEDLRGPVDNPTEWFVSAPPYVQHSINRLNILIHEYEQFLREQTVANPTIVCTFSDRPVYNIKDKDFELFTHQWQYGTVYINYCEVGKPLLDVFKDKDTHVGKDAVRPQTTWSADFMVKFGPSVPEDYAKNKQQKFMQWYKTQNYNFENLSLGMIPVATLANNIDINNYAGYNKVIKCVV